MKKVLTSTLLFILLLPCYSLGQDKKLTIEEAVIGQWTSLYPEDLSQLQWIPGTNNYMYAGKDYILTNQPNKNNADTLLKLKELNKMTGLQGDNELKKIPRIKWINEKVITFNHNNNHYLLDAMNKTMLDSLKLPENATNNDFDYGSKSIAYTLENNLYIKGFNREKHQISHEDNKEIVYGQEVHRREFGISKGTFWSPDGKKLAFYKKDESMVTDYPLVDITQRIASLDKIKYPMAGMKSHHVTIGIYNLNSENTLYLQTGKPKDKFLTNVVWGPEGKFIYVAVLNREQNHMKLNQYDASTGERVQTLFEEKHDKYVEPLTPIQFIPGQNHQFLWLSRRDGYNHLYLYNTKGDLIKQITHGEWEIINGSVTIDQEGKNIYFSATKDSPLERHLYKTSIKEPGILRLTNEEGVHRTQVNSTGQYILDEYSNMSIPKNIDVLDGEGKTIKQLLQAKNPLSDYNLGEATISTTKTSDGETDLYYRLIKPSNFNPDKTYPAIIYVYGGPHSQLVQNRWLEGARLWQHFMAQKGYVMLTLDNRGTKARGFEFENIIHRQLGKYELSDQMQGVKILKELGYVDTNRIGVHGWSYGGFMTTSMMLKKPDSFKVGVAGGPVIDWSYYEIMYGERYMDTPQENPEGYKNANLKHYVKNLKGELLIVNGYIDDIVVPQHSLSFLRECIKEGVQVDYFTYPRHKHNVRGKDRIHLMEKVTEYFDENL